MVQNNLSHLNKKVVTQITEIQFQYDDLNDEKILQIYEEYFKEGYNIVFFQTESSIILFNYLFKNRFNMISSEEI
ncbi:hypothetical protein pb186bvf_018502 [Paramecium bursaria]